MSNELIGQIWKCINEKELDFIIKKNIYQAAFKKLKNCTAEEAREITNYLFLEAFKTEMQRCPAEQLPQLYQQLFFHTILTRLDRLPYKEALELIEELTSQKILITNVEDEKIKELTERVSTIEQGLSGLASKQELHDLMSALTESQQNLKSQIQSIQQELRKTSTTLLNYQQELAINQETTANNLEQKITSLENQINEGVLYKIDNLLIKYSSLQKNLQTLLAENAENQDTLFNIIRQLAKIMINQKEVQARLQQFESLNQIEQKETMEKLNQLAAKQEQLKNIIQELEKRKSDELYPILRELAGLNLSYQQLEQRITALNQKTFSKLEKISENQQEILDGLEREVITIDNMEKWVLKHGLLPKSELEQLNYEEIQSYLEKVELMIRTKEFFSSEKNPELSAQYFNQYINEFMKPVFANKCKKNKTFKKLLDLQWRVYRELVCEALKPEVQQRAITKSEKQKIIDSLPQIPIKTKKKQRRKLIKT